jgi:probable addiction module antidote protein
MNSYHEDLLADLKDPQYAAQYLTAARKESREAFLLALRDVADAQKGMKGIALEAGVNRENLYRMLSEEGNPRLSSLDAILKALGIGCQFVAYTDSIAALSESGQPPLMSQIANSDSHESRRDDTQQPEKK